MISSSQAQLSDYQQAVLQQLGIVCWRPQQDHDISAAAQERKPLSSAAGQPVDKKVSQQQSLDKLQQLKQQTLQSYQGKVLCGFTPEQLSQGLLKDVMLYLNLTDCPLVYLAEDKLSQAKDYALLWRFTDDFAFDQHTLCTPPLSQWNSAAGKKRLWQLLQRAEPVRS